MLWSHYVMLCRWRSESSMFWVPAFSLTKKLSVTWLSPWLIHVTGKHSNSDVVSSLLRHVLRCILYSVSTEADKEIRRMMGNEDLNNASIIRKLYSLFQGTVASKVRKILLTQSYIILCMMVVEGRSRNRTIWTLFYFRLNQWKMRTRECPPVFRCVSKSFHISWNRESHAASFQPAFRLDISLQSFSDTSSVILKLTSFVFRSRVIVCSERWRISA